MKQTKEYYNLVGTEFILKPRTYKYRLENGRQISVGSNTIQIPILKDISFTVEVDVVSSGVLSFLGMDLLDKHQLYVDSVSNYQCSPRLDIHIPLTRKNGRIFLEWEKEG